MQIKDSPFPNSKINIKKKISGILNNERTETQLKLNNKFTFFVIQRSSSFYAFFSHNIKQINNFFFI
jgi:hypothetical protein